MNKLKLTAILLLISTLATPAAWGAATTTDVSVTKTDGVTSAVPGQTSLTYTIVVANSGNDITGVTVADTFPTGLTCSWTCAASVGSTCTAMGSGDISDTVDILDAGNVTYTATCTIASSLTGTLSNTAMASGGSVTDSNAGNNSATDNDTVLAPSADLSVTKTDSVDPVDQGAAYSYTITVSNAGPSDATSVVATETLPTGVSFVSSSGCAEDPSANPTCTLGTIVAGGMASYTINVTAPSMSGTITNSVSVASGVADGNAGNNTATEDTVINPAADLSITKTDGVTTAVPGQSVTYTIVASNAGPDGVIGATVADTFPADLTCTWTCTASVGSSCTAAGSGDINDTAVDLLNGGTATYTASCTISASATGTLSNTATISSSVLDPTPGNDSATDNDTVLEPSADLSVTKTDSADPVDQGAAYSYTITVSNAGPSDATSVVATETLPTGVSFVSSSGCAEDPSANPTCSLGTIAAGGMASYTINVTAPNMSGTVTNSVSVTSDAADGDAGNNTATEDTVINPAADLSITKTDGVTTAIPGQSVTYTIVASNAGPDGVIGATVADTFPADLTCTWTCAASAGSSCTGAGSGDINDTAVDLLNGGTATYTASCTISASATGTLSNTATISSSVLDPTPGNDSATDNDTVLEPSADLSVTKTDSADPVDQGAAYSYTITVSNAGPSDATSVVATETLPTGVSFVSSSGCAEDPTANPTCTLGTIAAGGMASYTINVTAPNMSGTVTNSVSVTSAANDGDPGNNTATEDTGINPAADLSITKTDGVTSAIPGQSVTYTIVASNAGPDGVTGATVADTFPADLTCTWTCAASAGSSCTAAGSGDINDTAVDLLSGGTATYTADCVIAASATGTLSNTATVSAAVTDPTPGNDSATDSDTVLAPSADLSIVAAVSPSPVTPGQDFTITVEVLNAGPSDATGVVLTTLPDPLVVLNSTSGCVEDPLGFPTCTVGTIAAGGSAMVVIGATAPTELGDFGIDIEVSSTSTDPDGANNTDIGTVTVEDVLAIPTASTWGLFMMIFMLTAIALRRLRF